MTDTITLPRVVIEQAIDALAFAYNACESGWVQDYKIDPCTKALRAALAQQAEQGWQPIATAPKDGKWALVYADEAVNCAFVKQGSLPKDWCGATMWNINPYQVTHWMSLPAAPKEAIK